MWLFMYQTSPKTAMSLEHLRSAVLAEQSVPVSFSEVPPSTMVFNYFKFFFSEIVFVLETYSSKKS